MMKNSDNSRRTKTHPDQASMFSNSSNKSLFSTDRKSSVRIACKVMSEMRADNSDKLQMKFTQLRIVLASQSIVHLLKKCRATKLQAYFQTLKTIERKADSTQIKPKQQKSVQFKDQSHYHAGLKILRSILTIKLLKAFQQIQSNKQSLKSSLIQQEKTKFDELVNIFNRRINIFFNRMKQLYQIKKGLNRFNIILQGHQRKIFYSAFFNIYQSNHQKRSLHYQNQQFSEQEIQGNQLPQYKVSLLAQSFEYIDLQDRESVCSENQISENNEINSENEFMTMNLAIKFASTTTLITTMNKIILKNLFHVYLKLQNTKRNNQQKTNTLQNTPQSDNLKVKSKQNTSQDIQSLKYIESQDISQQISINILPETTQFICIQPINTITSEQDEERERQKMIAANKLKNLFLFQIKVNFIHFRINLLEVNLEIQPTTQSNKSDQSLQYYKPKTSKQKQTASQKKLQAFVKKIYKEDNILTNFSSSQQKSTDITNNVESGTKLAIKQKQQQIKVEQYQDDFKPEELNQVTKIPTKKSLIFESKKQLYTNKVSEAVKQYLVPKTDSPLLQSVILEQNTQSEQLKQLSFFKMNRLFWIQLCILIPLIIGTILII